ncbi:MAG: 4'-phosphopantetheinyl transferase superfamily protein [Gammaproteobacteria bacterium]|nr:4'-phosphopantetheinyl transferase superfamily protein [Gammaproteobacteria bacterium]
MLNHLELHQQDVHIWLAELTMSSAEEKIYQSFLSEDELARAQRFRFPKHKQRFIAARATLRRILSYYLNETPAHFRFAYTDYDKPYLCKPENTLQFNLSHSESLAAYAITHDHAIGIDIEKMQTTYHAGIAQRYFSQTENSALSLLSPAEKAACFYRLWSRKEALIKAAGKGLAIPIASFTVSTKDIVETIHLEGQTWSLFPLNLHDDYQAAFATLQTVKHIYLWDFFNGEPRLNKVYSP